MDSTLDQILKTNILNHHYYLYFLSTPQSVAFLNLAGIVHQDIRPENILVNSNSSVELCDFGFSKQINNKNNDDASNFIGWYFAPEEILNSEGLGKKVDIWALGCIFAEAIIKRPLFRAKTTRDSIKKLVEILGTQSQDDLFFIQSQKVREYVNKHNKSNSTIANYIKGRLNSISMIMKY